jgi:hypothetical protein
VARTSRGQFRMVHLVRGSIHDLRHLASRSVAELLEKGERTVVGGPRILEGISSVVLRHHQFLDRVFCARGLEAFTRMA